MKYLIAIICVIIVIWAYREANFMFNGMERDNVLGRLWFVHEYFEQAKENNYTEKEVKKLEEYGFGFDDKGFFNEDGYVEVKGYGCMYLNGEKISAATLLDYKNIDTEKAEIAFKGDDGILGTSDDYTINTQE